MGGIALLTIRRRAMGPGAALSVALAACSAGTNDHPSPPTASEYDIEFPSTAAAVSVDTIQTFVFSASTPQTDCPSLLVARRTGAGLPTVLAQTDPVPLCGLLDGGVGQLLDVGYGTVSFLVVAQRQNTDYFSGCTLTTLSATSAPVSVQLQQVTIASLPPTTCTSVSDHCKGICPPADGG
jgi:hypothetical protein